MGQGETLATKFNSKTLPIFFTREIILNANKAVGCGIFGRFSNLDKYRPEAAADVISEMFAVPIVLDKLVKFRDPSLSCGGM